MKSSYPQRNYNPRSWYTATHIHLAYRRAISTLDQPHYKKYLDSLIEEIHCHLSLTLKTDIRFVFKRMEVIHTNIFLFILMHYITIIDYSIFTRYISGHILRDLTLITWSHETNLLTIFHINQGVNLCLVLNW